MPPKKPAERIPTELPLAKYVQWAWRQNDEHYEPPSTGKAFRTPMWEFVRLCAAHPALRKRSAPYAFQQVDRVRLRDSDRSFPWEEWFPDSDDPRMEFIATWDKVRIPAGADILALAVALADEKPLKPRLSIPEGYSRYVSIAGRLQELRGEDYINLPVERLGTILDVDPRTVSYYAAFARSYGLLERIAKAHKPSGQAAKYLFHCERFDMNSGEELLSAEDAHFHKDGKDVKDFQESKESDEQAATRRISEDAKRPEARAGFAVDFQKNGRTLLGAQSAIKIDANRMAERRNELKRQCAFIEAKTKQKQG